MPKYVPFEKFEKLERRLRRIVRRGTEAQRRDALAMILGLHGLRVEEVSNLTVGDFDPFDETLRVMTIKRGKPRKLGLGEGVADAIRPYVHHRDKSAPLLPTRSGRPVYVSHWQRFAQDLGKELWGAEIRFHAFRHTCAMRLYVKTKDIQRVKARLGHRSLRSTDVYVEQYGQLDDRRLERLDKLVRSGNFQVLPSLADVSHRPEKKKRRRRKGLGSQAGASARTAPPSARRGSAPSAGGETVARSLPRKGERELFDTMGRDAANDAKKTKKRREPSENERFAGAKTPLNAKRRQKATCSKRRESGERRPKSKGSG